MLLSQSACVTLDAADNRWPMVPDDCWWCFMVHDCLKIMDLENCWLVVVVGWKLLPKGAYFCIDTFSGIHPFKTKRAAKGLRGKKHPINMFSSA